MKTVKHLSVLLAVLLVASLLVVGFVVNAEEPVVITVTNEEEFAAAMVEANASATIVLANDITLTNGNTTMPGNFAGTFDGQNHTISGITSTVFAKIVGGTVKNVTFNGAITGGNRDLATVTVRAEGNATLENVTSNVNLTVTGGQNDLNAGGIVGYGKKVAFTNCTYAGTYTAENGGGGGFGGIVGYVNNDGQANTYANCTFTGTIVVNGTQTGTLNLGSIVGRAKSGPIAIDDATCMGTFTLNNAACVYKFGGVAGTLEDAGSVISGAFVQNTVVTGEGVAMGQVFFGGNVANGVVCYGALKMNDGSYLANDGVGLAKVLKYMPADAIVKVNADMTLPEGTPTVDLTYTGTLDGQGYTISGLSNTLFKALDGATIKNVNFKGTIVSDNRKASTIAYDTANDVWLTDITSYVDITCNAGNPNAGGIIGYGKTVICTNVTYAGNYVVNSSSDTEVGGIAGYTRHNGGTKTSTYTNCAFTGTITVNNTAGGHIYAGAILGNGREGTNNLVNCISTGKITINAGEALTDVVASGTAGNNNNSTYNITNCVNLTTFEGIEGVDGVAKGNPATTNGLFNATHANGEAFVFDGVEYQKYTAEGATVYVEVATNKIVTEIPGYGAAFSAGTVTVDKNAFVIATDDLSAFISVRDGAAEGTKDYRFIIAADLEKFATYENANLILTFTKDGAVVATATKNVVEDLKIYASATAAGNTYVAAEGDILTGIVVTDVPADAWDTVTVTVVDGETTLATGDVKNADVAPQTLYTITENTIDLNEVDGAIYSIAIEEHHEQHNYNPAFVVCINNADIYKDIYSGGYNPNYTWYLSVNGGAEFIPASFSEYDGGEWGYLRAELGAEYATVSELNIALAIVDNTTHEAVYYSEFYIHYGFYYDETKPEGITAIAPGDITVIAGPDLDGSEGAKKAFDGKHNTKVCTGDVGADNALIVELKNTFSLVGVGICNANDNEDSNGRTVLDFEIYVSADGTTWGEAVYVATAGDKNKADYSTNFQEMYHAFAAAVDAKFVKVVVNNDGLYQISDVLLYVGEAEDTPVEVPVPDVPVIEVSNYGIENHHASLKNHVAWVINTGGFALATDITDGKYYVVVYVDGKAKTIVDYSFLGTNWVRLDLETAGVTGIVPGTKMILQAVVYDTATGGAVCKTNEFEVTANVFSSDIPGTNVALPTTGLKEVTVNKDTLAFEGISVWNAEKESIAQLFDDDTSNTKMGGNVNEVDGKREVTITFNFAEATKVTYYTFYTGNDTNSQDRNPKNWTLYGKVGEEWVVLTAEGSTYPTGIEGKFAKPFSWAVANPQECSEYKLVLTTNGQFQLNELKLYTTDATVTAPTAAATISAANAEVVRIHRNDWLKNEADTKQFGLAIKADGNLVGGEAGLKTILDYPAYVYIKDVTAGGEYVRYEITNMETARHCDIRFDADGFTPEADHTYDIILFFVVGEGNLYPAGTTYAVPAWGFKLA